MKINISIVLILIFVNNIYAQRTDYYYKVTGYVKSQDGVPVKDLKIHVEALADDNIVYPFLPLVDASVYANTNCYYEIKKITGGFQIFHHMEE